MAIVKTTILNDNSNIGREILSLPQGDGFAILIAGDVKIDVGIACTGNPGYDVRRLVDALNAAATAKGYGKLI